MKEGVPKAMKWLEEFPLFLIKIVIDSNYLLKYNVKYTIVVCYAYSR